MNPFLKFAYKKVRLKRCIEERWTTNFPMTATLKILKIFSKSNNMYLLKSPRFINYSINYQIIKVFDMWVHNKDFERFWTIFVHIISLIIRYFIIVEWNLLLIMIIIIIIIWSVCEIYWSIIIVVDGIVL